MINLLKEKGGLAQLPEFDNHRFVVFLNARSSGLIGFIAIHRQHPLTPSFGATRLWAYSSELEALKDALRLSRMMSYKAALAGLKCGGAKAVIIATSEALRRRKVLLTAYAADVNFLQGQFITGTDAGLNQADLAIMKKKSPYFVGLNDDAAEFTARGLFYSIEICLQDVFGQPSLTDRTFAIQGLGKVGRELLKILYPQAGKIYVSDVNPGAREAIKKEYPEAIIVPPEEIHCQAVDVYCPCALGQSLNDRTLPALRSRIVVGGANNQLESEETGELLWKLEILYAPDYVVNAGGLISVVSEFENKEYSRERVEKKVAEIKKTLTQILALAKKQNRATNLVANEMAEKVFNNYHKIVSAL